MNGKIALAALLLLASLSGCRRDACIIRGKIEGLEDIDVFLSRYEKGRFTDLDSTWMQDGRFAFRLAEAYPECLYIRLGNTRGAIPLIIETGTIRVLGRFDSIPEFDVAGTPSNGILTRYRKENHALENRQREIIREYETCLPATDSLRMAALQAEYVRTERNKRDLLHRYVTAHKGTYAAAYLLTTADTHGFTHTRMDSLLNLLDPALPENAFVEALRERRNTLEKTAVGKPAPDFTLPRADGTPLSLSSLRGKCVLLDFWASWCKPCRRENPRMAALYRKYRDKGFTILGVSLDEDPAAWAAAVKADGLIWPQLSDGKGFDTEAARSYGVVAIPHTVLIDTAGVIRGQMLFGDELDRRIADLLGVEEESAPSEP